MANRKRRRPAKAPDQPARPRSTDRRVWLALAGLGLIYMLVAGTSLRQKSVTVDEPGHLAAGYLYLQSGDSRYASLNPPLINLVSALPLALAGPRPAVPLLAASADPFSFWSNGYGFMQAFQRDYVSIYTTARTFMVLVVGCLGVAVFFWARALCPERGDWAGLMAAALVWFSPGFLAHARLVTTDAGAALLVCLSLWSLAAFLDRPAPRRLLLCGLVLGLAQLGKVYALLLYPVFVVIVAARWRRISPQDRRRVVQGLLAVFVLSLIVLNSGYLWQGVGGSLGSLELGSERLLAVQSALPGWFPVPLPAGYVRGIDGQLQEVVLPYPTFLFGETFQGGRWYYYLGLLAIKTPLALWLLFGLGTGLAIRAGKERATEALELLLYPAVLFVMLSLGDHRQLGLRALLPAAPLVWLWVAVTLARSMDTRWVRRLVAALLVGGGVSSAMAYPDYLSYFNLAVGGSSGGFRHASDSNLDWGQDLPGLRRFLESTGERRIQLLYFGSVDPALYGLDYEVPRQRPRPGLLAVSVTLYHTHYPLYDHGRLISMGPFDMSRKPFGEPVADIAGSIHVYRVPGVATGSVPDREEAVLPESTDDKSSP